MILRTRGGKDAAWDCAGAGDAKIVEDDDADDDEDVKDDDGIQKGTFVSSAICYYSPSYCTKSFLPPPFSPLGDAHFKIFTFQMENRYKILYFDKINL